MAEIKEPELGSWAFLKAGWWIVHIVSITAIGYLGYYLITAFY